MIIARASYFNGQFEVPMDFGYGSLMSAINIMNFDGSRNLFKVEAIKSMPNLNYYRVFDGMHTYSIYTDSTLPASFVAYQLKRNKFVPVDVEIVLHREVELRGYGIVLEPTNFTVGFDGLYIHFGEHNGSIQL